jgi:hypothetical protein
MQRFHGAKSETFDITEYFLGETHAHGVLETPSGRLRKRFVCRMSGMWQDDVFVLDERFFHDDGTREDRTWRVRRAGDGCITATAPDVAGEARGHAADGGFVMTYVLRIPVKGWRLPIRMHDRMYRMDDGSVLNRATMRLLGVRVGELTFHFSKSSSAQTQLDSAAR